MAMKDNPICRWHKIGESAKAFINCFVAQNEIAEFAYTTSSIGSLNKTVTELTYATLHFVQEP